MEPNPTIKLDVLDQQGQIQRLNLQFFSRCDAENWANGALKAKTILGYILVMENE